MRIVSLQVSAAKEIATHGSNQWWDKNWTTGFFKQPTPGRVWLGYEGFTGDEQADRRVHGGVDKAVCVYPAEHYPYWISVFPEVSFAHGAFGENLTIEGLTEGNVCVGDRYRCGESLVEVSQPREPCWKLARRWKIKAFPALVVKVGFTGYYFRVLKHGFVTNGDTLELVERPEPGWTIQRCNEVAHDRKSSAVLARELSEVRPLSGSWKDALWRKGLSSENEN